MKEMSFDKFRSMLLYRSVVEWNKEKNYIVLDNGIKITIEMTDNDCCAYAGGRFEDVELQAVITDVTDPKYSPLIDMNKERYGCSAVVKMLHNQNLVCKVNADADSGNGGYYYSVASFIVTYNNSKFSVHLVGSSDTYE